MSVAAPARLSAAAFNDQQPGAARDPRDLSPSAPSARATGPTVSECLSLTTSEIVCPEATRCTCPLGAHVTDAERAIMNDIAAQAARLSAGVAWAFAVMAVVATILLFLR